MPRQKVYHHYLVTVSFYASAEMKERVQSGQEHITQPEQLSTQLFYSGSDERQAAIKFYQAAKLAMKSPLAISVIMSKDAEVIARVKPDR